LIKKPRPGSNQSSFKVVKSGLRTETEQSVKQKSLEDNLGRNSSHAFRLFLRKNRSCKYSG
jgi:hypothetical protein